jgi:hypothetical protein
MEVVADGASCADGADALGLLLLDDRSSLTALERDPDRSSPEERAPSERRVLTPESEQWSPKSLATAAPTTEDIKDDEVERGGGGMDEEAAEELGGRG